MRGLVTLLGAAFLLAAPGVGAVPITDNCTGLIVLSVTVAGKTTNCGTDCSGVLLVLGATVGGEGGTCQACDDNVANVGLAILGSNNMCSSSGTDIIRGLP